MTPKEFIFLAGSLKICNTPEGHPATGPGLYKICQLLCTAWTGWYQILVVICYCTIKICLETLPSTASRKDVTRSVSYSVFQMLRNTCLSLIRFTQITFCCCPFHKHDILNLHEFSTFVSIALLGYKCL